MKRKSKKIISMITVCLIIISTLSNCVFNIKVKAAVETVVFSEALKLTIAYLSGASISPSLSDEKQLELFDQNKMSYGEVVQYIVNEPELVAELVEEDIRQDVIDALVDYTYYDHNVTEMKKYIDGSLAEQIEDLRDQFSLYSNNENPNDDDEDKFKKSTKKRYYYGRCYKCCG